MHHIVLFLLLIDFLFTFAVLIYYIKFNNLYNKIHEQYFKSEILFDVVIDYLRKPMFNMVDYYIEANPNYKVNNIKNRLEFIIINRIKLYNRISLFNSYSGYHLIIDMYKFNCNINIYYKIEILHTEDHESNLFLEHDKGINILFYEDKDNTILIGNIKIYLYDIKNKSINFNNFYIFIEDNRIMNIIFLREEYIYNIHSKLKDNSRMLI